MYSSTYLLCLLHFAITAPTYATQSCYNCASNPNPSYYQARIDGFQPNNLPKVSDNCITTPQDSSIGTIPCEGSCFKWQSTERQLSGGITYNVIRGCYSRLVDADKYPSPEGEGCRLEKKGNENIVACWCKDDLCNSGSRHQWQWLLIVLPLCAALSKLY